jgi:hypothetical protein
MKKMKKLVFVLFAFIGITMNAQEKQEVKASTDAPVFKFDKEVIDYGTIDLNSDGVREFKFTNVGKSPLVISNIKSSCGCTVPTKPTEPIMPGKTGKISVKYATNRPGGFSKSITIFSNASEKVKILRIKGIVIKPETAVAKKKPAMSAN